MGVNLPVGYQLLAKQFNMERVKDGSVRFDNQAMKDRFTPDPSGVKFSPPDWSKIFTKQEPVMSEDEFEKAIAEQAVKDFENGYRRFQSVESANLEQAFIQAISPDRKAIYAESMSKTGGQMNLAHSFYTGGGEKVLHYNTQEGQWMNTMTSTESARFRQFADNYNKAYLAAHSAAQGSTSPSTVDYRA